MFNFIDLFAGIGGLRSGFDNVGGQCVFTSERNKFSIQTYKANFQCIQEHKFNSDITQMNEEDIPSHDLLLAGFPCQPFSIAGVSKKNSMNRLHGFLDETQGTLFFDVARILRLHRPKAFVLENVKNLLSHDRGNTFKVIHSTLVDLGYNVQYKIIDAKNWLPQHRERIFIVGFLDENSFNLDSIEKMYSNEPKKISSILHPENGSEITEYPYTEGDLGMVNTKYTLSDKLWIYLQKHKEKHSKKGNGFGYGLVNLDSYSRTLSARYYKDGSEILIPQMGKNPRRLTPRECSRLMGFEDFKIPVSDTQAYMQFGNAVSPKVSNELAKLIHGFI